MEITAVLINVTGIQEYIFHSNKLRENIGASYIIEKEIYENVMLKQLKSVSLSDKWRTEHEVEMSPQNTIDCEIGYVGGGNALLLFREKEKATHFIKAFSKAVLAQFPGLRLVFGQKHDFDLGNYKMEYQALMQDLKKRKSQYIPLVSVQKHGITADCPWSNDSAENVKDKDKYISKASFAKIEATKMAQKNAYSFVREKGYELTTETSDLGQGSEKSYIAVVHIDGNGMGSIFANINELEKLRKKSVAVSTKAEMAMNTLLNDIIDKANDENYGRKYCIDDLTFHDFKNLPIRPILVGGDDITFICEGRLGMYLAEKFITFFYDEKERKKAKNVADKVEVATKEGKTKEEPEKIEALAKEEFEVLMDGACAGVAIVKSHFPFYKAVELAEQLCAEAKKESRENKGSYISYYYSATTFSGSLAQLRERTHKTSDGKNLYFGPYRLFKSENYKENDSSPYIEDLRAGIKFFKGIDVPKEKQWANNKVMVLREVLVEPLSSQNLFKKEMNIGTKKEKQEITFPNEKIEIWEGNKTPYFDQIELMDFYLPSLLT